VCGFVFWNGFSKTPYYFGVLSVCCYFMPYLGVHLAAYGIYTYIPDLYRAGVITIRL